MAGEELCENLITWIQTFNVESSLSNIDEVSDGVGLSQILCLIGPNFFKESWSGRIKKDVGDNWRLKVSNLRKVLEGILDFYSEEIGQETEHFRLPDLNKIGEHGNPDELGRLLQLVLGCAVNCDHKEEYINNIMSLEESVQHAVMNAIQELMSNEAPVLDSSTGQDEYTETDGKTRRLRDELNKALADKEDALQKCHELDLQVSSILEEKNTLQSENELLLSRIDAGDNFEDPSTPIGRKHEHLQETVDQLQEELFRLESQKDDFKIKADLLERELQDVLQKNEQLSALAEEARALKDEMDILRHSADKVSKYEATIDSYKKKLDDLSDLRKQVKILEDKNTMYMQNTVELEEELKKANSMKAQLDAYKKQVHELHSNVSEETRRADKHEFEVKRLQEKMAQVQNEKERLQAERDTLKETNEELTLNQLHGSAMSMEEPGSPRSPDRFGSPGLSDMLSPEMREKMIRLQHENKMLQMKMGENSGEKAELLQSLLDDANARKNELESEARISNQKIMTLEAELEEISQREETKGQSNLITESPRNRFKDGDVKKLAAENQELRKKLQQHKESLQESETELQRKRAHIDDIEPLLSDRDDKVANLQEVLQKKDEEMRTMEDRYRKYLEKAKSVIRTLDPKHNTATSSEVQLLRNQLQEKTKIIEHLEMEREKSKATRDIEEKLIVSAWYNMGVQKHRKAAEERLSASSSGQSFLSRQRQASNRRSSAINSPGAPR
ncbi:protein Hook homolog 3-like isoform X2 [Apostichopus japonicus]|uniref:protein Hook homolog 3-like isoform X2 n=1 Tax=Stichopus japonicus TaxID=307972 RepID=UPI003AB37D62